MSVRLVERNRRRRGVAFVTVLVTSTVLFGMAALTVDVGLLYNTRAKMQNTADAAVLSAVHALSDPDSAAAQSRARAIAASIIARNSIWGQETIQNYEIVFGQSRIGADPTQITFDSTAFPPNAMQVTLHYNLSHAFSGFFGVSATQVNASATSAIGARDIMFVLDSSCTMSTLTDTAEVAADLTALAIPFVDSDSHADHNGNGDSDDSDGAGGVPKVMICHVHGRNRNESKTISIAQPAVAAHLAHGDTLGPCAVDVIDCNGNGDSDSGA